MDAQFAAEEWAEEYDNDDSEYTIVRGTPVLAAVRPEGTDDAPEFFNVYGEYEPTYGARPATPCDDCGRFHSPDWRCPEERARRWGTQRGFSFRLAEEFYDAAGGHRVENRWRLLSVPNARRVCESLAAFASGLAS